MNTLKNDTGSETRASWNDEKNYSRNKSFLAQKIVENILCAQKIFIIFLIFLNILGECNFNKS